jgi:hypothetical protein
LPDLIVAVPIALAMLDRSGLTSKKVDDRKNKERELLGALAERGELTPTATAMRTSLTVEEATKMLDELAGRGDVVCLSQEKVSPGVRPSHDGEGAAKALPIREYG